MNVKHPGFLVWNPAGHPPSYQHQSIEAARREAERLAVQCPGDRFYVLAPVGVALAVEPTAAFDTLPPVIEVADADLDRDIPF